MCEVELYTNPWVSGTRAAAYFGPISVEIFIPDIPRRIFGLVPYKRNRRQSWSFVKGLNWLMDEMKEEAACWGGNAVVGIETTIDPFTELCGKPHMRFHMVGTAAKLEPLFSD